MHYNIDHFVELWNFLLSERSFKDNVYPITNNLKAIAVDAKAVDKRLHNSAELCKQM